MQVRKRNGSIVPFDREFISRAITLAAVGSGGDREDSGFPGTASIV